VRSWLSEADGTGSNTRVCIAAVVFFALGWVTALITRVRGPVTVAEIASLLGPLGMFVTGICVSLYGINKFADAWGKQGTGNREQGTASGPTPPAQG
jgi:hypothetical protein